MWLQEGMSPVRFNAGRYMTLLRVTAITVLSVCLLSCSIDSESQWTRQRVDLATRWLGVWVLENKRFPQPGEGLSRIATDGAKGRAPLEMIDAWGRGLRLVNVQNETEQCVVICSTGEDGIDSHGKGDDICSEKPICHSP